MSESSFPLHYCDCDLVVFTTDWRCEDGRLFKQGSVAIVCCATDWRLEYSPSMSLLTEHGMIYHRTTKRYHTTVWKMLLSGKPQNER